MPACGLLVAEKEGFFFLCAPIRAGTRISLVSEYCERGFATNHIRASERGEDFAMPPVMKPYCDGHAKLTMSIQVRGFGPRAVRTSF